MANEAETPATTAPAMVAESTPLWKSAIAWVIGLVLLFILIYVISRAWKKGQAAPAA